MAVPENAELSAERSPSILLVEDEVLVRFMISDYLQDCGFKVFEASAAAEAIEILDANLSVDLAFCDVILSGVMDGIGLAQWIRRRRPDLPIVFTSADPSKAEMARRLCEGAPFLAKPFDVRALVELFRVLIAAKPATGPN